MGSQNSGTVNRRFIDASNHDTGAYLTGSVPTQNVGDEITADTYLSMITIIEKMLNHSHTYTDYYWSNCECECGGGGTT